MPLPVLTIAQMREWEKATWATGQTETEVIRRVGKCLACLALSMTHPGDRVVILAGKGNNGADALGAQNDLADRRVEVLQVTDPAADLAKLATLLSSRPSLIIDGLFGIGLSRPLAPDWVQFIERLNSSLARVLAVDVPSGLDADTGQPQGAAVRAVLTLTVGAPKVGLLQEAAWPFVGRLEIAQDVGLIPCPLMAEIQWTLPEDFAGYPPARAAATHKGTYGHLAIIAGSLGYHGAAVLCARGAQRAKPGLITLFTLEQVYYAVASQLQAVMVSPVRREAPITAQATAFLLGPGLAAPDVPDTLKTVVRHLWRDSQLPVVVDASALDWLPLGSVPKDSLRVITPHPGEAARLIGASTQYVQSNRLRALRVISKRFGDCWVVLKGHQTLIGRSTGEVYVNSSGNPYLAQGGSGDVLSGYLAGLLTQPGLVTDPLRTIRYAVWQHGATADLLQAQSPNWVIEDLIDALGNVPRYTTDSTYKAGRSEGR
jgi:NAD(P)H-hydrate epimerase